ncbi:lipoprotein [Rugamonas sp. DEMB1]|uniref:lipoprotein n=1 Tax=Rugamonas sp. DEMB1 TaxID=3039386 RepID=UPI00391BB9CA
MRRYITFALTAALLLTGCANTQPVSTTSLRMRPVAQSRVLVFDSDFLFTNSKPGNNQRYVGLLAGR